MKILEVRDGFIKFEAGSDIVLSSFVVIEGNEKSYIAQVIQLRQGINGFIAQAKILFLYDGELKQYDKTLPSVDSEIRNFTSDIIENSIYYKEPIIIGKVPALGENIIIDSSAFNKKLIASIDDSKENNILVRNVVTQFNNIGKNVLIIDALGVINAKKYTAGVDFKLPLDTASLEFMYHDCLNDATQDSKSLIIEIFRDLSEYSKTVPFVPFEALRTIVNDMVDKSHIFKLLVLKNKLNKFEKLGYFAKDKTEVDKIETIFNSKCAIIDISKLDTVFQNRYLSFLYEKLQGKENIQVILELSNVVSKKNLKHILNSENVSTMFITHSRFKYLNDFKNLFDNFIIAPSLTNNSIFSIFGSFLNNMKKNSYLISGESINYMQFVSEFETINDVIPISLPNNTYEEVASLTETEDLSDDAIITSIAQEQEDVEIVETSEVADDECDFENDNENIAEIETEVAESVEIGVANEVEEENEVESVSQEEIIASIEEKSEAVISDLEQDLTQPELLFDDNEDNVQEDDLVEDSDSNEQIEEEYSEDVVEDEEAAIITDDISEEELEPALENQESEMIEEPEEEVAQEDFEEPELIDEELEVAEELIVDTETEISEDVLEELEEQDDIVSEDLSSEDYELNETSEEDSNFPETSDEEFEEIEEVEIPHDLKDLEESIVDDSLHETLETYEEVQQIIPIKESEDEFADIEEIVELSPEDADEDVIVVDLEDELGDEVTAEDIDEQITRDVDKVFTTRVDDNISDSDLDLIDQINSDDMMLEQPEDDAVLEELSEETDDGALEIPQEQQYIDNSEEDDILETKSSSTPIVPVYDAEIPNEDLVMSDPIEQGDYVTHAKYGSGVVEKMIKYGSKTLYSINFENLGRRLLDPTLTEIKKR